MNAPQIKNEVEAIVNQGNIWVAQDCVTKDFYLIDESKSADNTTKISEHEAHEFCINSGWDEHDYKEFFTSSMTEAEKVEEIIIEEDLMTHEFYIALETVCPDYDPHYHYNEKTKRETHTFRDNSVFSHVHGAYTVKNLVSIENL